MVYVAVFGINGEEDLEFFPFSRQADVQGDKPFAVVVAVSHTDYISLVISFRYNADDETDDERLW